MNTNNPITEIGAIGLAALLIVIAGLLVYADKINIAFASSLFILAASIFAGNLALKAPSPAQQAQIGALQQGQQQLTSQVLSVLPQVVSATSSQPAPQPTAQQQFQASNTFEMPVVPK